MTNFKFDGSNLSSNGSRVGRVSGNNIYDGNGSQRGRVSGDNIYDSNGHQIGRVSGNSIYDGNGHQLSSLNDVRRIIDGPGGTILAALWLCLVR